MTATFYDYTGVPFQIDKVLGDPFGTSNLLKPYEPLSDLEGKIILEYNQLYFRSNYCIVNFNDPESQEYTKNYFITNRELLPGGKMALYLSVDTLTTYKTGVLNTNVICVRCSLSEKQSSYIYDIYAPVETRREVKQQQSSISQFNTYGPTYLLVTSG